jgi:hypothetical protein
LRRGHFDALWQVRGSGRGDIGGGDGPLLAADDIFRRVEFRLGLLAVLCCADLATTTYQMKAEQQRAEGRGKEDVHKVPRKVAKP